MNFPKESKPFMTTSASKRFEWPHRELNCGSTVITLQESIKIRWRKLNRPITKFYNSDDVNTTAAELRQTKAKPIPL